jgi:hypothetical protein
MARNSGIFPYNASFSWGGDGRFEGDDPYYNQRGEDGYFRDTALGAPRLGFFARLKARRALRGLGMLPYIPSDAELSTTRDHTPLVTGWVSAQRNTAAQRVPQQIFIPSPFAVGQVPTGQLNGLRDATSEATIAALVAHQDKMFALSLVSTSAVAVSALITIFRTIRLIKHGDKA